MCQLDPLTGPRTSSSRAEQPPCASLSHLQVPEPVEVGQSPTTPPGDAPPAPTTRGPHTRFEGDPLTKPGSLVRILSIMDRKARAKESDRDGDRAATLQLVIAIGRTAQAIERGVRPHLAECGLGLTEFAVLEVLYHKGALPLGEIRDRILVTGASTTYVVTKLEERGLMRRRTSDEDQRVVFGELTPKGRALMDQVFPAHVERLRAVTAGLSAAEKRAAAQLLRRLSHQARRTTGERITEDD